MRNLGPPYPSTDLICGGAYAQGLEVARKAYYGKERLSQDEAINKGILAAWVKYGDHEPIEKKKNKSAERVGTALVAYGRKFPFALDHIQPHFTAEGEPLVEFTFSLPMEIKHPDGDPMIYAGRFDLVGKYRDQLVVLDDKSTSQLGPSWPNSWNLRGQFTGYVKACHEFGLPVIGAIARGCSFLSYDSKTGEPKHEFAESIQMRPQWMIDQWWEQLHVDTLRLIRYYENGYFDQVFADACAAFGGCPFQRLCNSSDPENWIDGHYGYRNWNPLEKIPYIQPESKVELIEAPPELQALLR